MTGASTDEVAISMCLRAPPCSASKVALIWRRKIHLYSWPLARSRCKCWHVPPFPISLQSLFKTYKVRDTTHLTKIYIKFVFTLVLAMLCMHGVAVWLYTTCKGHRHNSLYRTSLVVIYAVYLAQLELQDVPSNSSQFSTSWGRT